MVTVQDVVSIILTRIEYKYRYYYIGLHRALLWYLSYHAVVDYFIMRFNKFIQLQKRTAEIYFRKMYQPKMLIALHNILMS